MRVQNDPNAKPFLHLEFIPAGSIKEIKILNYDRKRTISKIS